MMVKVEDLHDKVSNKLYSLLEQYNEVYKKSIVGVDKKSMEYFCKHYHYWQKIKHIEDFIQAYQKRWTALHRINYVYFDKGGLPSCRLYSDTRKHERLNKQGFNLYIFKINILDIDKKEIEFYRDIVFKYYADAKKDPRNIIDYKI